MRAQHFRDEVARLGPAADDRHHADGIGPNGANGTIGTGGRDLWPEPDLSLFGTGRRAPPAFPLHLFGPWAGWCERKAKGASAPVDYVAVALLASVSAAIANVRWPKAGSAWSEPAVLWCAEVGPPSSSKSPSMDAAFNLVRFAEDRMADGFEQVQQEHATAKQACEARIEAWKIEVKTAIKNGDPAPAMPADAQEPPPPVRPRIRVADATVEALGALAAGLPRGLLLVRDELAGWLGAFDKYGGGGSDRAFAIEMYGGRAYVVDRMKNPEPLRIRHLSIGVLGGVQPDKLEMILNGPDDGLASRLLWSWPETKPEFNLARGVQDDGPMQRAFARLTDLLQIHDEFGHPEPVLVPLDREAEDRLEAFARDIVERCHMASGLLAGTLGKARGHCLRLSAVLEYLWWCGGTEESEPKAISPDAVTAAADLLNAYFLPMAERVFGDAVIPVTERRGMLLAQHLRQNRVAEFNAREVRRQIGGMLRDAADMDAACKQLVEAGLIRPRFIRAGEGKGRKAMNYEVHPEVQTDRPFDASAASENISPLVPTVPMAPIAVISKLTAPTAQTAQGGKIISDVADPGPEPQQAELYERATFEQMIRPMLDHLMEVADKTPVRGTIVASDVKRRSKRTNKHIVTVFTISAISRCVKASAGPLVSLEDKLDITPPHKRFIRADLLAREARTVLGYGGDWPCWIAVVEGDQRGRGYPPAPESFDSWFRDWIKAKGITVIGDWRDEARADGALAWLRRTAAE